MQIAAAAAVAVDAASNRTPNASPTPPTKTTTATLPTTKIASTNPTRKNPQISKKKKKPKTLHPKTLSKHSLVCWSAPRNGLRAKPLYFWKITNKTPYRFSAQNRFSDTTRPPIPTAKPLFSLTPFAGALKRRALGLRTASQPISPPIRYHSCGFENRVADRIVSWCRNTRSCRKLVI